MLVVGDEEEEIVQGLNLLKNYSLVVTSGGIGPTHDDITYQSIAKAFQLPLELDTETQQRMDLIRESNGEQKLSGDALKAQQRMCIFPVPNSKHYISDDLWTPIVQVQNVHILPGIPKLFEMMLKFLVTEHYASQLPKDQFLRYFVSTTSSESQIATLLEQTQLHAHSEGYKDIKIGSYPHFNIGSNTVSIVGLIKNKQKLEQIVQNLAEKLPGKEISYQQELENTDTELSTTQNSK